MTAHDIQLQEQDTLAWISGMYIKNALEVVLANAFGKHVSYMDKSIMAEINKYAGLTDEEIDEIEIRKMIADADAEIAMQKMSGLSSIGDFRNREG